ncbi:hypothetical protein GEMRC1_011404 [Eukaryota sp. GEM-RC1]
MSSSCSNLTQYTRIDKENFKEVKCAKSRTELDPTPVVLKAARHYVFYNNDKDLKMFTRNSARVRDFCKPFADPLTMFALHGQLSGNVVLVASKGLKFLLHFKKPSGKIGRKALPMIFADVL